jgi:Protein of unknown function (DUF3093)
MLSAWTAMRWAPAWTPAWIAAGLFIVTTAALLAALLRPAIEIHETHLRIGRKSIPWSEIRRVDQSGRVAPLAVYLTLAGGNRVMLVYPGDLDSSASLLRHLRRYSRQALLDGIPYRQFWGEPEPVERRQLPPARVPLLRPEDEEEVERLFQKLKTVGRLDPRGSGDD